MLIGILCHWQWKRSQRVRCLFLTIRTTLANKKNEPPVLHLVGSFLALSFPGANQSVLPQRLLSMGTFIESVSRTLRWSIPFDNLVFFRSWQTLLNKIQLSAPWKSKLLNSSRAPDPVSHSTSSATASRVFVDIVCPLNNVDDSLSPDITRADVHGSARSSLLYVLDGSDRR